MVDAGSCRCHSSNTSPKMDEIFSNVSLRFNSNPFNCGFDKLCENSRSFVLTTFEVQLLRFCAPLRHSLTYHREPSQLEILRQWQFCTKDLEVTFLSITYVSCIELMHPCGNKWRCRGVRHLEEPLQIP
jgi:hypothetical protein